MRPPLPTAALLRAVCAACAACAASPTPRPAVLAGPPGSAALAPAPQGEGYWLPSLSHASFATGYKRTSSAWSPARDHWVVGLLDVDVRGPGWPLSFASQLLFSYVGQGPDIAGGSADDAGTWEVNVGARKVWRTGVVEPFVGGGLSYLGASATDWQCSGGWCYERDRDDDETLGAWLGAGVFVDTGPFTSFGVHLNYTRGDIELFGEDIDAGGLALLVSFGARR